MASSMEFAWYEISLARLFSSLFLDIGHLEKSFPESIM